MMTADDCIQLNKLQLETFAKAVKTAVDLFTLLERGGNPSNGVFGGIFHEYRVIAARDAALNIYHFGKCLEAIPQMAKQSTLGKQHIDIGLLGQAITKFETDFPNTKAIRDTIAHAGELYNSIPRLRASIVLGKESDPTGAPEAPMILGSSLFERTYTLGKSGQAFSFVVDDTCFIKLMSLAPLVHAALQVYHERLWQSQ